MTTVTTDEAKASESPLKCGETTPDLQVLNGSVGPLHPAGHPRSPIEASRSPRSGHRCAGGGMKSASLG
ncbi:MAG: hypothetical protein DI628_04460 [Blastochloris viridis]|uniref:Uncharacterized protein n=1 Tax=Blastochloris viridis TaxID=1079 RepID=A0A6N4RFF3_BLAVI|nr:MAG: hypothetical protein DI628_04460 [Blastochloris viridis]